jgi:hypothetical protein
MKSRTRWTLLAAAAVVFACVLSFYRTGSAQQRPTGEPPFANAVEQRAETVKELREIKELLREQNALLRSGNVRVIVTLPEKKP